MISLWCFKETLSLTLEILSELASSMRSFNDFAHAAFVSLMMRSFAREELELVFNIGEIIGDIIGKMIGDANYPSMERNKWCIIRPAVHDLGK